MRKTDEFRPQVKIFPKGKVKIKVIIILLIMIGISIFSYLHLGDLKDIIPIHFNFIGEPDSFGPKDLDITTLLMDKVNHGYKIDNPSELAQQALQAANRSHAPYSESHSGIAVQMKDGKIFQGSYAENAAFNPSLPPLQAALILLNMAGESVMEIESAVLIEKAETILTQWDATQATLTALGCRQMQRITL